MDDRRQLRLDVFRILLEKSGHLVMTVTPQELQKDAIEVADALWVLPPGEILTQFQEGDFLPTRSPSVVPRPDSLS